MTSDDIKALLDLVRQHEFTEFELEDKDFRLKVRQGGAPVVTHVAAPVAPAAPLPVVPTAAPAAAAAPAAPAPVEADGDVAIVKSPIVGTFYRSSEPGARAFVEVGDTVRKGQVLCIIEAMKLMNEIDSDVEGEITTIYVENGHPVQYGDRLFAVRVRR
jgi:acetyl-CoA carboxylase biotin carboxyl carrier protein